MDRKSFFEMGGLALLALVMVIASRYLRIDDIPHRHFFLPSPEVLSSQTTEDAKTATSSP